MLPPPNLFSPTGNSQQLRKSTLPSDALSTTPPPHLTSREAQSASPSARISAPGSIPLLPPFPSNTGFAATSYMHLVNTEHQEKAMMDT